jgi:uncharacterized protein (DUF697 family)
MPPLQCSDQIHTRIKGAEEIVQTYVMASVGTALIPLPVVDIAALTAVQLKMLHSLARHYDIPFLKDVGKSVTASLLGGLLTGGASGPIAASISKLIPGFGSAVGLVSLSVIGSATTYAIGKVFIQHFESGGTFLALDPEAVREHFMREFEEGKPLAADLKASATDYQRRQEGDQE